MRYPTYLLAGCIFVAGCDDDPKAAAPPKITEASASSVGNTGFFTYRCISPSDAFCSDNPLFARSSGIPTLAVSSQGDFFFKKSGGTELPIVDVVSPTRLKLEGNGRVTALLEGRAGILGSDGKNPSDAYNVRVAKMATFHIEALTGKFGFHAWFASDKDEPLAGNIPCKWTIDDPAVAKITTDPASTVVVMELGNNGKTLLHLAYGSITRDIPVEVNR